MPILAMRMQFFQHMLSEYVVAQLKSDDEYSRADETAIVIEPKITA
jgi:hypothetical protein